MPHAPYTFQDFCDDVVWYAVMGWLGILHSVYLVAIATLPRLA